MNNRALASRSRTLFAAAGERWRTWRDRREVADFAQLNPDEAGRLARDFRMNVSTLLEVTAHGTAGLKLLELRAHQCGIDLGSLGRVHPGVARDLARCCALCRRKSRCARDLRADPKSEAWRTYCPNRETFGAILAN